MNEKIRNTILRNAKTMEPNRENLVRNLVEFEGHRYPEVVEALDGLLSEGLIKNVSGNVVLASAAPAETRPAKPEMAVLTADAIAKVKLALDGGIQALRQIRDGNGGLIAQHGDALDEMIKTRTSLDA